jgi:hypothetical protein
MRYTLTTTDETQARTALEGWRWRSVVECMDNYLRNRIKYEDLPEPVADALQAARDELWEQAGGLGLQIGGE